MIIGIEMKFNSTMWKVIPLGIKNKNFRLGIGWEQILLWDTGF